jgi:beta-lactamase class A
MGATYGEFMKWWVLGLGISVTMFSFHSNAAQNFVSSDLCGELLEAQVSTLPLPKTVTGRVGFFADYYKKGESSPSQSIAYGPVNAFFPTISMYKSLVVFDALEKVDQKRLSLNQKFITTPQNQSIEKFPPGSNPLSYLLQRTIQRSDNTASDIVHLAVGPKALAYTVKNNSPCTNVLITSKAWWGTQGGLFPQVIGKNLPKGIKSYYDLPFEARVDMARKLIAASMKVTGKQVELSLDRYFGGPNYTAKIEFWLQNITTPQAYTRLFYSLFANSPLSPKSQTLFRDLMKLGCCYQTGGPLPVSYRAAKIGSGWRMLTLSGYTELKNGDKLVYTYMNDQSDTKDSNDMDKQIRVVNQWIDLNLAQIAGIK